MTGAQFIAETLKAYGVSHVFFMESILRMTLLEMEQLGVSRVLTHSEAGAAYMADGYARASGRPGVCMAQSVGAANLAAGLQDAYLGRSAVIAITGRKPPIAQYRNAYQEVAHPPLFAPVTRYSAAVSCIEQLPVILAQAFREVTAETPRPVGLEMNGLMGEFIERASADLPASTPGRIAVCPAHRLTPEQHLIEEASRRITNSERPVIVVGRAARISAVGPELTAFARSHSIPVAYALDGKGLISDTDPLCAGVVGSYSAKCGNQVVSRADLVVFIGCDTGDQATLDWRVPAPNTAVIQIDADVTEAGRNYPDALAVIGDPKLVLVALSDAMPPGVARQEWLGWVRRIVSEWTNELKPTLHSTATPIRVERLCSELSRMLPADAIFISDTGYSAIWTGTLIQITAESQIYLRSAGSLGWAFPAALGAKCACPERPVICFTGDGGFYYHLSELETAARWNIRTITIVNNNSGFGQCLVPVENVYGGRPGRPSDLTRFSNVNFARIAEDFGCCGIRVERPEEIRPALERALHAEKPTVVDVVTDPRPRAPMPWTPPSR